MYIILLGAPGSGKGTIGNKLSSLYNIPTISTGDLLRENINKGTQLGKICKKVMDEGKLVSDELVINLIKERLQNKDCKNGCIFDGFPRNIAQAEKLDSILKIDSVILLDVPKEVIEERILSRRTCPNCKKIFNIQYYDKDYCDECNTKLVTRTDDNKATVEKRFVTYNSLTRPLVNYYKEKNILSVINGNDSVVNVIDNIKCVLKERC